MSGSEFSTNVGHRTVGERVVSLTLCSAQVQSLFEQVIAPAALADMVANAVPESVSSVLRPLLDDDACSRSIVRGLLILASFPPDGLQRELTAVAADLGLSPGTTHRYLYTLTAAGLLGRDSESRRYYRPPAPPQGLSLDSRVAAPGADKQGDIA